MVVPLRINHGGNLGRSLRAPLFKRGGLKTWHIPQKPCHQIRTALALDFVPRGKSRAETRLHKGRIVLVLFLYIERIAEAVVLVFYGGVSVIGLGIVAGLAP